MKREFVVGLVFLVLVGLLLAMTLWIKDPDFLGGGDKHVMTARFRDVAGLRVGDPVWVYGTEAGEVRSILPDGNGSVAVELAVDYDPELREDADVSVSQRSALGGAVVAIHPGSPESPRRKPGIVDGTSTGGMFDELSQTVRSLTGPLESTVTKLDKVVTDFSTRSESIATNVEEFAKEANAVAKEARMFVDEARNIAADVREGKGTLGKLLQDDSLHSELEAAVASLKKIAADADGGGGTLDLLLHDQEMASRLKSTVARIDSFASRLDAGGGTLGRLMSDSTLYDNLNSTAVDLRQITAAAKNGQGALGKLLYDPNLAQRIDVISGDVAQITGRLRRGEGTLGRMIQDDELYADLRGSLKSLKAGVGDARENAPILTFASFLFGGF